MSPGRSNKPLFEILSERPPRAQPGSPGPGSPPATDEPGSDTSQSASPAQSTSNSQTPPTTQMPPSRAVPAVQPKPAAAEHGTAPAVAESTPAGQPGRPTVTMPLSTVYLAAAGVMALLILTWVAGHAVGGNAAKQRLASDFEEPDLREPPADSGQAALPADSLPPGLGSPTTNANQPITRQPTQQPTSSTPVSTPSQSGRIIIAGGRTNQDPRQAEHNYLELATLPEAQAIDAVNFLASNGVSAIATPESASSYRLICTELAVPSTQWSAMAQERATLQREVADVGDRWVRDRQGGSNFSQTLWRKYVP